MMAEIFLSPSRPFYQSTSMMSISSIPIEKYSKFAQVHFKDAGKSISPIVIAEVYQRFEGVTWYVQRVMNEFFSLTPPQATCDMEMLEPAITNILRANEFNYQSMLFQLPPKQKELLVAIAKEGKAKNLTSSAFVKKYRLTSSSSVQSAIKGLLEKNFVTVALGTYEVYDKFFALWLLGGGK
jgi:hypothetical protein